MFVRSGFPFNYDSLSASSDSSLLCLDDSLAIQSAKDEADINVIVRRFGITGELPVNPRLPEYADFVGVMDFHTAMNAIRAAEEKFMALPGELRDRFRSDPQNLMDFLADESNRAEAEALGLINQRPAAVPVGSLVGVPPASSTVIT